jgi:hypothetical protein
MLIETHEDQPDRVELHLSASELKVSGNIKTMIRVAEKIEGEWRQLGKTEYIKDDANPVFSEKIVVEYFFGRPQLIQFELLN